MKGERRRHEPWPIAVAALLLFMIGGSVGFLRVALRYPDPLVVTDTHGAKHDYPESVRAARRTAALGWQITLEATPRPGAADVRIVLSDDRGRPIPADRVVLRRERPAEGGLDDETTLQAAAGGWTGAIELPRAGRWTLVVRAERGDEAAERSFALWMPGGGEGSAL